jgi:hypothetical protein
MIFFFLPRIQIRDSVTKRIKVQEAASSRDDQLVFGTATGGRCQIDFLATDIIQGLALVVAIKSRFVHLAY